MLFYRNIFFFFIKYENLKLKFLKYIYLIYLQFILDVLGLILSGSNFVGYYKCNKGILIMILCKLIIIKIKKMNYKNIPSLNRTLKKNERHDEKLRSKIRFENIFKLILLY